ncbi:SPFH domain / Band 7 family protein [Amphritea atlantica]|uniref:SPFH domain / Band 7 family protein n=1 Tax=Amphritea atlantica TaxID=355243 RepID=A0A1H9E899_9GAMM|nr:SPFH domain-containing protein [Amphritea atlantica]SEQ21889.1 SPFH domain / Band 7 family protein [Amphritea atlantica]
MFGIKFFKADAATYAIKTANGKVRRKGQGISFWYNPATASIACVPTSVQEASFIFNLQTEDFQEVRVQGQLSYRIVNPDQLAEVMNYTVSPRENRYTTEDPLRLDDRMIRFVQNRFQADIQAVKLREALKLTKQLMTNTQQGLAVEPALQTLGIEVVDLSITGITPAPETVRALEAEARESILKEADDAIYLRRKAAVEQERTIREAELQTDLEVQKKEQEIKQEQVTNERNLMRARKEIEQERLQADIEAESQRIQLVQLNAKNGKIEAETQAYAIEAQLKAYQSIPVESLKAMAMSNMQADQLFAFAFDSLAQNAAKIGELNISPDLFSQLMKKAG